VSPGKKGRQKEKRRKERKEEELHKEEYNIFKASKCLTLVKAVVFLDVSSCSLV